MHSLFLTEKGASKPAKKAAASKPAKSNPWAEDVIASARRLGVAMLPLKAVDMPVIRRSGNLDEWRDLHGKVRPAKLAKSGSQHLKEMRAERAARGR